MPQAVVAYCRGGFEDEAAADLRRLAAHAGSALDVVRAPGAAVVVAHPDDLVLSRWERAVGDVPPIFARTVFAGHGPVALLAATTRGPADRVTPLLAAIDELAATGPWRSVWVEYPDTNDGKALSPLSRALEARLAGALQERGRITADAHRRLHVLLQDGATAFVGTSVAGPRDWPLGIPRLRMPPGAPSRSTAKLAEAFGVFLGESEARLLRPGLRAVDLGAAPGGWTWQLAQRGLKVAAVDNGPLKGAIAQDALVTHLREDGLRWRPARPVDWLVCDIVEQPIRIADLVAHWIADGMARHAIFNLKLPMKKRYDEVRRCTQRIAQVLDAAGVRHTLAVRQLYHDREEVTAYLARRD
ncbi:MAG: 23S rRNA (cytidine(2498)-2'-O)-methyltransferase RlmM [Burkholderiales bacterium]